MFLIAVLWAVYLSECCVRWKPGQWVFRRTLRRSTEGVDRPDFTLWNERVAFAWNSGWPADLVFRCAGTDLDTASCRSRLAEVRRHTRWLRASAAALFVLLLFAFPLLVVSEYLLPVVVTLATAVLLAWVSTFTSFMRTYRRVHGIRPSAETRLTQALSPVSLISSPAVVTLDVLSGMHPVAVAEALCGDDEFLRIARQWHFDVAETRPVIERIVAARGLADQLTAPPEAVEPGVARFCPRCHATFTEAARVCADCPEVELAPLQKCERPVESSLRNDEHKTSRRTGGPPDVRRRHRGRSAGRASARTGNPHRSHRRKAS